MLSLEELPQVPLLHILSFLQPIDLSIAGSTCKKIYHLSKEESLWKVFSDQLNLHEVKLWPEETSKRDVIYRFTKFFCSFFTKEYSEIKPQKNLFKQRESIIHYLHENVTVQEISDFFDRSFTVKDSWKIWTCFKVAGYQPNYKNFMKMFQNKPNLNMLNLFIDRGFSSSLFILEAAIEAKNSKEVIKRLLNLTKNLSVGALNMALINHYSEEIVLDMLERTEPNKYSISIAIRNNYSRTVLKRLIDRVFLSH
jgi:hypothetical protein